MPVRRTNVTIDMKGAIFSASETKAAGARFVIQANEALAIEGVSRVRTHLDTVLRRPTGYYKSRIAVERRSAFRGITDSRVVYGGWLEGIDSRNKTTRFKGYHTFRIVKQQLNRDRSKIVGPMVRRYIGELNK